MVYGREKAWGESDRKRRLGYQLFGELHVPGRLRSWHVMKELRRRGLWNETPRALLDAGGGEGAFAYHVARRFPSWQVAVADNEPKTIERARRIGFHPSDYGHVRDGYSADDLRLLFNNAGLDVDTIKFTFGRPGTLMFDLFFATGDNRPNPLVYAALLPMYLALAKLDVSQEHAHGAAILGIGRKP